MVRRAALDVAWETALSGFPVELHAYIRRYAEAREAANDARGALTVAKARHNVDWWKIDRALQGLARD